MNIQTQSLDKLQAEHYDYPPEFYQFSGYNYSCPLYLKDTDTYDMAVINKWELLCQQLELKEGMSVLEMGCGWGGLGDYMVRNYGVNYIGCSVAESQVKFARKRYGHNYIHRSLYDFKGKFDRIVSDEVLSHQKGIQLKFFEKCRELLKPDGVMVHKEGHITEQAYGLSECLKINETFAGTGQYREVYKTLNDLSATGFETELVEIPISSFIKAQRYWIKEMDRLKEPMCEIAPFKHQMDKDIFALYIYLEEKGYLEMWVMKCVL